MFAVMEISTTPGVARWFDLWSLTTDIYENREEAIRTLERRSVISSALDVQADDQILLLVTCLDGDTERLVVAARTAGRRTSQSATYKETVRWKLLIHRTEGYLYDTRKKPIFGNLDCVEQFSNRVENYP